MAVVTVVQHLKLNPSKLFYFVLNRAGRGSISCQVFIVICQHRDFHYVRREEVIKNPSNKDTEVDVL